MFGKMLYFRHRLKKNVCESCKTCKESAIRCTIPHIAAHRNRPRVTTHHITRQQCQPHKNTNIPQCRRTMPQTKTFNPRLHCPLFPFFPPSILGAALLCPHPPLCSFFSFFPFFLLSFVFLCRSSLIQCFIHSLSEWFACSIRMFSNAASITVFAHVHTFVRLLTGARAHPCTRTWRAVVLLLCSDHLVREHLARRTVMLSSDFCGCQLQSVERYFSDEVVLYVLRYTALLAYVLVVSWGAVFWRQGWSMMLTMNHWCVTLRQSGGTARDEVEQKVDEVLSAHRSRRGWILCSCLLVATAPFFIFRVVELHLHGVWGAADHEALRVMFFDQSIVGVIVWSAVLSLVHLRGHCSNFEFTVFTVLMQCWFNLNMWTVTNTTILFLRVVLVAVMRVVFAVVSKVPVVLLLNVVSSLSMLARLQWSSVSDAQYQLHDDRACYQRFGDAGVGIL